MTKPIIPNTTVRSKYRKDLERLASYVISETEKEVASYLRSEAAKDFYTGDASASSQLRIRFSKKSKFLSLVIREKSKLYSKRMVDRTDKESSHSLNKSVEGLVFKPAAGTDEFKSLIEANVDLITSMNESYIENIKGVMERSIQKGGLQVSLKEIRSSLTKEALKIKNKAKNVALDQTRKANTSLTQVKMTRSGIRKFQWIHSGGGQNPRSLHKNVLNGKIYELDNPPVIDTKTGERGLPAQAINCKCIMRPIYEPETA